LKKKFQLKGLINPNFLFLYLILIILFPFQLFSQEELEIPKTKKKKESTNTIEIGIRFGGGYKHRDKIENDLRNYKTISNSFIYSQTTLDPIKFQKNGEIFFRTHWGDDTKIGFTIGNLQFNPFKLSELNSIGEITEINFRLQSTYLFLNYFYHWKFKRSGIEAGFGFGVNQTELLPNGYYLSKFGYYNQTGYMTATGLAYRLEANYNYYPEKDYFLQIGSSLSMYTAPEFSGSFNDDSGALYVRNDGSLAFLTESESKESLALTNYASRRLDLQYTTIQIHLGIGKSFDY
jgi:hypothetical protein